MEIRNVIILGMYPYSWHYRGIMDTVRLMTAAFNVPNKIFLNPSVGFRRAKAEKQPLRLSWRACWDQDVLVCTPPLEPIPSSCGLGEFKDSWSLYMLRRFIERRLGVRWREETVVYVTSGGISQSYRLMRGLQPRYAVFDVLDDNLSFPGVKHRNALQKQFAYVLKNATVVTAVSQFLVNHLRDAYGITAHYLPNGVDFERFAYCPAYGEPLQELSPLERPLLGFVGTLTSWIDFELLMLIAENLERGTLVLIGPVARGAVPAEVTRLLHGHPRVAYLGPQPYERVPHFLHQFDVLLLPRNYESHSLASDPLKLYEYMATGKPIVATAIPSVRRFADLIYVCESRRDFLSSLLRALNEWSQEKANKEIDAVREMSWHKRAEHMMRLVYHSLGMAGSPCDLASVGATGC